jgi:hypothetical protein
MTQIFCALPTHRLMMEAVSTSETSVNFYETTRRSIPEGCYIHTRRRENLKSHMTLVNRWGVLVWRFLTMVIICKIVLLDFVHRLHYKIIKSQRFEIWILLSSSGKKKGGRGQKAYLLCRLVELASDLKALFRKVWREIETRTCYYKFAFLYALRE